MFSVDKCRWLVGVSVRNFRRTKTTKKRRVVTLNLGPLQWEITKEYHHQMQLPLQ